MKLRLGVTLLALASMIPLSSMAVDQTGAEATKKPVSVKVVDVADIETHTIGNIQVTYEDGTTDQWTTKGGAGDPRVAPDGTVGWTLYGSEHGDPASYTTRPNGNVVVCRRGKVLCRVESALPHVEEWDFIDGGAKFVLKSRGRHGPAKVELFETETGSLLAMVPAYSEDGLPKWAESYRD